MPRSVIIICPPQIVLAPEDYNYIFGMLDSQRRPRDYYQYAIIDIRLRGGGIMKGRARLVSRALTCTASDSPNMQVHESWGWGAGLKQNLKTSICLASNVCSMGRPETCPRSGAAARVVLRSILESKSEQNTLDTKSTGKTVGLLHINIAAWLLGLSRR